MALYAGQWALSFSSQVLRNVCRKMALAETWTLGRLLLIDSVDELFIVLQCASRIATTFSRVYLSPYFLCRYLRNRLSYIGRQKRLSHAFFFKYIRLFINIDLFVGIFAADKDARRTYRRRGAGRFSISSVRCSLGTRTDRRPLLPPSGSSVI